MMIELLDKSTLILINKTLKYPLAITISPQTILSNWKLAKKDKRNELTAIHYSEELSDENVETQLRKLHFAEISAS